MVVRRMPKKGLSRGHPGVVTDVELRPNSFHNRKPDEHLGRMLFPFFTIFFSSPGSHVLVVVLYPFIDGHRHFAFRGDEESMTVYGISENLPTFALDEFEDFAFILKPSAKVM